MHMSCALGGRGVQHALARQSCFLLLPVPAILFVTRLLLSPLHSEMESRKMSILASAILRCRVLVAALEAAKKSRIACRAVTDFAAVRGGYCIGYVLVIDR